MIRSCGADAVRESVPGMADVVLRFVSCTLDALAVRSVGGNICSCDPFTDAVYPDDVTPLPFAPTPACTLRLLAVRVCVCGERDDVSYAAFDFVTLE